MTKALTRTRKQNPEKDCSRSSKMTSACKWPIGTVKVLCPIALWDCFVITDPSFLRNFVIANKRSESVPQNSPQSHIVQFDIKVTYIQV